MYPQSELENYKLQVELLQEKLHRSEDNRQELEKKLQQIMKKRNEHEGALRLKSQLKYQQFLDELKKRNERNRKIVDILERIDQQGAALSAKSERLKMMKVQYELYFSKLVQSCAVKKLQNSTAVSLPPFQRIPNTSTTLKLNDQTLSKEACEMSSSALNTNTSLFKTIPLPVVIPISNEQKPVQASWMIGSAQPGVLIALSNNATPSTSSENAEKNENQPNFYFDYSQFPIGYLQAASSIFPMPYDVTRSSLLQQPHNIKTLSEERHTKQLLEDSIAEIPSFPPFVDVKTNETISNREQNNGLISEHLVCCNTNKEHIDSEFKEDVSKCTKPNGVQVFNENFSPSIQSVKDNKLLTIQQNNSSQQQRIQASRKITHQGNIPTTIDFRSDKDNDDKKYIKYIKEMEKAYEKNHPIAVSLASQELNTDNITTTLQIKRTEKIDETNVRDYENINDMYEHQKNTLSDPSASLHGKCSKENIVGETLTLLEKPLEYKTEKHISNIASARNIDPSRDTEQITLFNGTQNSQDESTRASNRTTAIIDGDVGENKENTKNRRMDSNTNPSNHPPHFEKKEKMSIENIETAIYGELLMNPENHLTFPDADVLPPDNLKGNGGDNKEIEQNSQQTEGYEFSNFEQDLHEPNSGMDTELRKVASFTSEIENIEIKQNSITDKIQESCTYNDNVGSIEDQQYNMQNYTNPNIMTYDEGAPMQNYSFHGEQDPQNNNYVLDCQEYNDSQYQTEYDASGYPYDYTSEQLDENNQTQYASNNINQKYEQDQYEGYQGNYEENVPIIDESSYQSNIEGGYEQVNQEVFENKGEENYTSGLQIENIDDTATIEGLQEEFHEQITESEEHSTSGPETLQTKQHPTSILSTEKYNDLSTKKKKRVNFVDSETDESSRQQKQGGISSESDFDFSN